MKCPKCGYNSFESNDMCIKCSHDLTAHKRTFGLKTIVLQKEARTAMAAALVTETAAAAVPEQPVEQPADLFSFDLPDEEPAMTAREEAPRADLFSFSDTPAATPPDIPAAFSFDDDRTLTARMHTPSDAFESLLESTPLTSAAQAGAPAPPAPANQQSNAQGEYDLSNFSWDDTPETSESGVKKPVDDFDSLFGDIESTIKK